MYIIACLCKFFNGGFTFEYADNLTIPEILNLKEIAEKINKEEEKIMRINSGY